MKYKFTSKISALLLVIIFTVANGLVPPLRPVAAGEWGNEKGEIIAQASSAILPFPLAILMWFLGPFWEWGEKMFPAEPAVLPAADLGRYLSGAAQTLRLWLPGYSVSVYEKEIGALKKNYPELSVEITSFADEATYFNELQKSFQRSEAPDIFLVNTAWLQKLRADGEVLAAAAEFGRPDAFARSFYPLAAESFFDDESIWAAPLFGKFPVLISNAALLGDERVFVAGRPGKTWPELFTNWQKFREYGDDKMMPVAIGHPVFAPLTFDLFLLLLEQADIGGFAEKGAADALSFLLGFAGPYSSRFGGNAEDLFLRNKIAVMFGDEATVQRLKSAVNSVAKPPREWLKEADLQLDLLPQFRTEAPETIGEAWGFAISRNTSAADLSWALALHFSGTAASRAHYLKSGYTPLLKGLTTDIFAASAALATSAPQRRNLDFETLFRENVLAHFPEDGKDPVPAVTETLRVFADFFASHEG